MNPRERRDKISIVEILRSSKSEIIRKICSQANKKGKSAWLWYASKKCRNSRVCLVAHVDTVFDSERKWYDVPSEMNPTPSKSHRKKIFYDQKKRVFWSPDGLGADDRAGVYACLKIRELTGCTILLTDHEECGGLGASEACEIFKEEFQNVDFFIEIDRKGKNEAVFYNGESQDFKVYITSFGFNEHLGSFSDISILSRNLKIAGVNVSAGYYHQHTRQEYLNMNHLESSMQKVINIIQKGGEYDVSKFKISEKVYLEFGSYHNIGHISLYSHRYRKSSKMARRWEF